MPRSINVLINGRWVETRGYTAKEFAELRGLNENTLKSKQVQGHPGCLRDMIGPLWVEPLYDAWVMNSAGKPSRIKRPKKDRKATPGRKKNGEIMEMLKSVGGNGQ